MNYAVRHKRYLAVSVGLGCSFLFLGLSLHRIDLYGLGHALAVSRWWPWFVLAPLIYLAGHLVRGLRCRTILQPHCAVPLLTATNCTVIGYAANNVLPARMGEFVRAYALGRKANVSISMTLAVTFLERVLDGLVITGILLVASLFAPLPAWGRELRWVAALVFSSATVAVVLITAARPFVLSLVRLVADRLPLALGRRIASILSRAFAATDCLRDPALTIKIVFLSLLVWIVEGGMFLVVLPAFGLPLNSLWAGMALSITNLGILIPSSPGYIGPFHYFCMQALRIFTVGDETALGYAIMVHLLYYVPITVWGLGALAVYGISLNAAARTAEPPLAAANEAEGVP